MAELKQRGIPDSNCVNANVAWELEYWCQRWGCDEHELRSAVRTAGVMAKDVVNWLRQNGLKRK